MVDGDPRPPDVRVDDPMDRCVPVETDTPTAAETQLPDGVGDLDMVAPRYKVGPHLCRLTAGDT
eukprot:5894120-Amphidinium_carterae.1